MAFPAPQATPGPQAAPAPSKTLTIECNPDGTYLVTVEGDAGEPPDAETGEQEQQGSPGDAATEAQGEPQVAQSLDEVIAIVQHELGESQDPQAMWQQEAAKRQPQPGGPPPMSF